VLVRAAGLGDRVEPDLVTRPLVPGDLYLLCTDGLTNMLGDTAILRTLEDTLARGLDAAARALVDAANERGGIDNITVALLRIG
jgi:protein phosphatase